MDVSATGEGSPVADVPPVASSGGEGWAAVVGPWVSCVGVDLVVIFLVLIFDCGGWGWFVSLPAVCVGVR